MADKLGSVSEASRISGISRDTIYRHRRLIKEGGKEALKRQVQVSAQLKANYEVEISPNGVRYVWLRENMNTQCIACSTFTVIVKNNLTMTVLLLS